MWFITVSLKTQELIQSLSVIDFDELATLTERKEEKQKIREVKQEESKRKKGNK